MWAAAVVAVLTILWATPFLLFEWWRSRRRRLNKPTNDPKSYAVNRQWRVGRSVGRTIYAVVGVDPDDHYLIGMMDTPELAIEAVAAHNAELERRQVG